MRTNRMGDAQLAEAEEILAEQLSRNTQFLGAEAQARVASSLVVVVGVGAVGSHVASLLARTGVRRLRLVDPGTVHEASLRTHAVAAIGDLGLGLADVTARSLHRIVPDTAVECHRLPLGAENAGSLLGGGASMVVVCVPDADVAALCIVTCEAAGARCLTVLSAAAGVEDAKDVAHQRLSALHDTCGNVEARQVAARVRALLGARAAAATAAGEATHLSAMAGEKQLVVHSGASRAVRRAAAAAPAAAPAAARPASRGAVLAGLGHAAASACLCQLAGVPLPPSGAEYTRANREEAHRLLVKRERDGFGCADPIDLWPEDLEYLVTDVWGGRCPFSGASLSGGTPLALTRWDRTRPAAIDNVLLASRDVAEQHDKAEAPYAALDPALVAAIGRALARARAEREVWRAY